MTQVPDPLELADKLSAPNGSSNGSSIKTAEEARPAVPTASTDVPPTPRTLEVTMAETAASTTRTTAAKRPAKPPKASAAVASLLPAGERVHVYIRRDGKRNFIDDYAYEDFHGSGSMERFLKKHVVPKYGYGAFDLYLQKVGIDSLIPLGSVGVQEPNEPVSKDVSALKELLEAQKRMTEDAAKNTPSLLENVKALAEMKTIFGDEKGMKLDPMLMFLLNQGGQNKKDDSPLFELLTKLTDRLDRVEKAATAPPPPPMPLPPPPPPPPDRTPDMIMEMMRQNNEMNRSLIGEIAKLHAKPERDPIRDLAGIAELVRPKDDDKLSTKDIINLLPSIKEILSPKTETKGGLAELMDQFRMMQMLKHEVIGETGGGAPGFWEFAQTLVNSKLGESIGDAIAAAQMKGAGGVPQLPSRRRSDDEDEEEGVVIPQSFAPFAQKINEAIGDPQKLAPAIIHGLQHLGTDKQFRPVIFEIVKKIRENEKTDALKIIGNLLTSLAEAEAIKMEAAKEAVKIFDIYWLPICHQMNFKHDRDPAPYQNPPRGQVAQPVGAQPAGPQTPQPTPPQPVPQEEPEEEVEEEDEDYDEEEAED